MQIARFELPGKLECPVYHFGILHTKMVVGESTAAAAAAAAAVATVVSSLGLT